MSRVIIRPLNILSKPGTSGSNLSLGSLIFTGPPTVALAPQALVAIGGTPPYTFSAIGLPAGVTLNALTGVISGTPSAAGVTTATATVTDSLGAMASAPVLFDIVAPVLSLASVAFSGLQNAALTPQTPTAAGGTGAYTFTAVGLPAGVSIVAGTGAISGTPTGFGITTATITVTDSLLVAVSAPAVFDIGQTQFADNFNRTDTADGLGPDYIYTYGVQNAAANDNPNVRIFSNRCQWSNATITSQAPGLQACPRVLSATVWGQPQFAQVTYISSTFNNSADFLCVMQGGNWVTRDWACYLVRLDAANRYQVISTKTNAAGVVTATSLGNVNGAAANDVIRLEVIPNGVTDNHVGLIINGTLQLDVPNDASATRPIASGLPGLTGFNLANASTIVLDDFSCGLGTLFI